MKLVIQRVADASVEVDNEIIGQIDKGLMVLVGFGVNDTTKEVDYLSKKLIKLYESFMPISLLLQVLSLQNLIQLETVRKTKML